MLYDSFWGKFEEQISAKDNYYNHYLYQGWQHWGMGIGNPLLPGPILQQERTDYFYQQSCTGTSHRILRFPLSVAKLSYAALLLPPLGYL